MTSTASLSDGLDPNTTVANENFVLVKTMDASSARGLAILVGIPGYIFIDEYPTHGNALIEYKIKAEHKDGGFSEYSKIVQVQDFGN